MKTAFQKLLDLYDPQNEMVFCGEELGYDEGVWKMYTFLRQYVKPMWPVNDMMVSSQVAFIVDDMVSNINFMLESVKLRMDYSGGNLYLVKSLT